MSLRDRLRDVVVSAPMGRAVNVMWRGRIPSGRGVRVDLSGPDVPDRTRAAVAWRRHERQELRLIADLLPSGLDVVELGAGFGVTTAHVARKAGSSVRVVAVEANPVLARRLETARGLEGVQVVHGAIAYQPGETTSFFPNEHPMWGSLDPRPGSRPPIDVPRYMLRQVLEQQRVGDDFVLVADIEGREPEVLTHDAEVLTRCACAFVDLQPDTHGIASAIQPWFDLGFQLIAQRGRAVVFRNPRWDLAGRS